MPPRMCPVLWMALTGRATSTVALQSGGHATKAEEGSERHRVAGVGFAPKSGHSSAY